jgi:hypothetical protein
MQFHIDQDVGSLISGWVNPDNPGAVPTLVVLIDGREQLRLRANILRPDVKRLGNHSSGMVGFAIDDSLVPRLHELDDIRLLDADTNILIYRRSKGIARKIFCFDFCGLDHTILDPILEERFTFFYRRAEYYPFDTLSSIVSNQKASSIYIDGHPAFVRYDDQLRKNDYAIISLLRHPYEYLAQRLLLARANVDFQDDATSNDHTRNLRSLTTVVKNAAIDDPEKLEKAFNSLSEIQISSLSNLVVKSLACEVNEPPDRRHVAIALNNLAGMELVGLHSRFADFKATLSELLKMNIFSDFEPIASTEVADLAKSLSELPTVRKILALDLLLYSHIEEAVEAADLQLAVEP